jgi:DNA-binding IclR family transcriptional regulator
MEPKPIRSFARGLTVLSVLNRHGSATALTLARDSGVPRPTVYRLLQTLMEGGYIGRSTGDDRFYLKLKVRSLSEGFADEQWISSVAAPALEELTRRISWPCDAVALHGLKMVIHERTTPATDQRLLVRVAAVPRTYRTIRPTSNAWPRASSSALETPRGQAPHHGYRSGIVAPS